MLIVDRVDALADAILIAQRSRRIALQAVLVGMGLSLVAMAAASVGLLPPAAGAVLQEVIDVLAIGLALRAVLPGATHSIATDPTDVAVAQRLKAQHDPALYPARGGQQDQEQHAVAEHDQVTNRRSSFVARSSSLG